jgi:spore maturation protein CgeB
VEIENNPLSPDKNIKDATRGYIFGCLACQHQLKGLPSMAGKLPDYVLDDLQLAFPPQISGDSIETQAHFYDFNYFNPVITYMQRDVFLQQIEFYCDECKSINIYNRYDNPRSDKVTVHKEADYYTQVPLIARKSRINLVITNRNWKSAIPQISWDIMASGGFLLSDVQNDFYDIFKDTLPIMYDDKYDLLNKSKYYLENTGEREQIAKELSDEVMDRHTYVKRINEMLGQVLNDER